MANTIDMAKFEYEKYAAALGTNHRLARLLSAAVESNDEAIAHAALAYIAKTPQGYAEIGLIAAIKKDLLTEAASSAPVMSLVLRVTPNKAPPQQAGEMAFSWSNPVCWQVTPAWEYALAQPETMLIIMPKVPCAAAITRASQWFQRDELSTFATQHTQESTKRRLFHVAATKASATV